MGNRVIDLRRSKDNNDVLPLGEGAIKGIVSHNDVEREKQNTALFSWSVPEYESREYSVHWFLIIGAVALLFVLIGIVNGNIFFAVLIGLAYAVIVLYAKRAPRDLQVVITREGVSLGTAFYLFKELQSFWIFESSNKRELSFETGQTMIPFVRIPLGDVDAARLRKCLAGFLQEKEHQELFSDVVTRSIGF